jgi:hypothetical protein
MRHSLKSALSDLVQIICRTGRSLGSIAEHPPREVADTLRNAIKSEVRTDVELGKQLSQFGPDAAMTRQSSASESGRNGSLAVADYLEKISNSKVEAIWRNMHPRETRRDFEDWTRSPVETPLFALCPDVSLNCWEMILYAATRSGVISHAELHSFYPPKRGPDNAVPVTWFRDIPKMLIKDGVHRWSPDADGPQPQRGDLIIWSGSEHVAVATGRTGTDGSPEIYEFFPLPDTFSEDMDTGSLATVTKAIRVSTVADSTRNLLDFWARYFESEYEPDPIIFGRGRW